MKRICILYNQDLSSQTRILRQAETLLDAGYEVTVLCVGENKSRPKSEQTASADLGLQPIINWNMNHYLCLPNKIFEYIQAGLPVVASHFPEMKNLIDSYKIGFVFDPDNPAEMADRIRRFFDSPEQEAQYRANLHRAKQELNWENEEKRLSALYQDLFSPS